MNFEFDLRRIIALSTLSQLGLMIITISIGLSGSAFFHLLTHALFKALLFICAEGVIHSIGDSQDIHFMGGLPIYIPFTSSSLMVSKFTPFVVYHFWLDFILKMFPVRYVNMLLLSNGKFWIYSINLLASE
jgi:NADH-ubiquinone oxidoreductase chain 5